MPTRREFCRARLKKTSQHNSKKKFFENRRAKIFRSGSRKRPTVSPKLAKEIAKSFWQGGASKNPQACPKGSKTILPATGKVSPKTPKVFKNFLCPGLAAGAFSKSSKWALQFGSDFWQGQGFKKFPGTLQRMENHFACQPQGTAKPPKSF